MRFLPIRKTHKSCHHRSQEARGERARSQYGGAMIEAAIVMPFYLVTVLASVNLMRISSEAIKFQFATQTAVRETFTRNSAGRGNKDWGTFFNTRAATLLRDAYLLKNSGQLGGGGGSDDDCEEEVESRGNNQNTLTQSGIPATVPIGTPVRVTLTLKRDWFGPRLVGITLPKISLKATGVAVVQMGPTE